MDDYATTATAATLGEERDAKSAATRGAVSCDWSRDRDVSTSPQFDRSAAPAAICRGLIPARATAPTLKREGEITVTRPTGSNVIEGATAQSPEARASSWRMTSAWATA